MQQRYEIRHALAEARKRLTRSGSDNPALDAHILVGAALGLERAYLLAHPEEPIQEEDAEHFQAMLARAERGEPLPYILGRAAFYDRDFIVSPAVLIPRPETELLLEQALHFSQARAHTVAVDIGTGSGALAVTLAALCQAAIVYAVDISQDALEIARRNAIAYNAEVVFFLGDLLGPILARQMKVDLLMANLPYIQSDVLAGLAVGRFEPQTALDGGADGLALIRRLLADVPRVCRSGALVLLEIGYDQGAAALALAQAAFPGSAVHLHQDYSGQDRIIRIEVR